MGIGRDQHWMRQAMALADEAEMLGEVPVGAVLVREDKLLATGFNSMISCSDPSAHAEIMALRAAGKLLNNYRITDATLYVTIEPCTMCAGALVHARLQRLVFGAFEPRAGAICSTALVLDNAALNHQIHVTSGVLAEQCAGQISRFFRNMRKV